VPTKIEKDAISGRETTGHEWDGLKELNTPLPKWWLYVFIATVVFAIGQFLLYPSVPGLTGYFHGLLGYSQRTAVEAAVADVAGQRAAYMDKIEALAFAEIKQDPQLYAVALTAGRITFANNCQPCHGAGGEGRVGYPALGDDVWLWGGRPADIQHTIAVGIRSDHPDTRSSLMPAFGADGILKAAEVQLVADYVMGLYGAAPAGKNLAAGEAIYAENCVACHGDKGQGNQEQGGPPLAARVHLNAGDRAFVVQQINQPRMGMMPAWNTRLDTATIKALTLYVHQLGGGQ
jgi:cytochrome c oxidase cbb3-type subunit III